MSLPTFKPGIETLIDSSMERLSGRHIGLATHPAALDMQGRSTDQRLLELKGGGTLTAIFSPEHGIFNAALAGEHVPHMLHPLWNIPIHSLYGETRRPTSGMLDGLDLLLIDFQDISIRPYTYVSTVKYLMEAAAARQLPVIVADRPDPLANIIDGPFLDPSLESFVGAISTPFAYGMTLGETALFLKDSCGLNLDLHIAHMDGYHREPQRGDNWHPWIPPSPSIRTWETAIVYPSTVLLEAIPCLDHGRSTATPFQLIGAPWINATALVQKLGTCGLEGVHVNPCAYSPTLGRYAKQTLQGIRLTLAHPDSFKPLETFVRIFTTIRDLYGSDRIWTETDTRTGFFDQLAGTTLLREQLQAGKSADEIIHSWSKALHAFATVRQKYLLYPFR